MKRFGILLLALAFTSLACETLFGNAGQATNQPPAGQVPVQPPVIQLPNLSGVQLGDEFRDEGNGCSFRKVPNYDFVQSYGAAQMSAPGADRVVGPIIGVICGIRDKTKPATLDDMVKELRPDSSSTPEANPLTYSNQQYIKVGGVNAVSFDIKGTTSDGIALKGRIAAAMVTPYQSFVIVGEAPLNKWEDTRPYFEAVMNSVSFFEPKPIPTANP